MLIFAHQHSRSSWDIWHPLLFDKIGMHKKGIRSHCEVSLGVIALHQCEAAPAPDTKTSVRHVFSFRDGKSAVVAPTTATSRPDNVVVHDGPGFRTIFEEDAGAVSSNNDVVVDVHTRIVGDHTIAGTVKKSISGHVGFYQRMMRVHCISGNLVGANMTDNHLLHERSKFKVRWRHLSTVNDICSGTTKVFDACISNFELSYTSMQDMTAVCRHRGCNYVDRARYVCNIRPSAVIIY
mmetsp:Transcript_17444/g.26586  ORF Transcript_17444/g.26586 Transcript_17444/m.26586 type:complete len:237 (-) Transcript_17444:750-1460(-)